MSKIFLALIDHKMSSLKKAEKHTIKGAVGVVF